MKLRKLSLFLALFGFSYIDAMQKESPLFIPPKQRAEQHALQNEYHALFAKKGRTAAEDQRLLEVKSRLGHLRQEMRSTFRK